METSYRVCGVDAERVSVYRAGFNDVIGVTWDTLRVIARQDRTAYATLLDDALALARACGLDRRASFAANG